MKKILLTAMAAMALIHSYAQERITDTGYKPRKLKLEEINLISSYYGQDGDNAAVTGGIGSEKLTDIANVIDIKFIRYDKKLRKHNFTFGVGIDHYTSASSDKVDLKANSSASHADTRIYPTLEWSRENTGKGITLSAGLSSSTEYDYQSFGGQLGFSKKTNNKMGEWGAKMQVYIDQLKLVTPTELRPPSSDPDDDNAGYAGRNTFAGSLSYSQVINKKLQMTVLLDIVKQQGYLSLPFHRVYLDDASVQQEKLPGQRFKIPLGVRINYFMGDKFIWRTYYRFYKDDWGLKAHTANIELVAKLSPFVSLSPFYRLYTQTAVDYFKPYGQHSITEKYRTSNYDFSRFNSQFFGLGVRLTPAKGVFGCKKIDLLEIRYGHYLRSTNLNANIVSMHLRFRK